MSLRRAGVATLAVVAAGALGPTAAPAAVAPDWPGFGGGSETRLVAPRSNLRPAVVPKVRKGWVAQLDGAVAGSPLILGAERLALVGTNAGSLYALELGTGAVRWRRTLGAIEDDSCHALVRPGGGDIGLYGISATPALDPATRQVYVADALGRVFAILPVTGDDVPTWPRQVLPVNRPWEHPWGALTLAPGHLYLTTGGLCPGVGSTSRIFGIDLATNQVRTFDPAPAVSTGPGSWGGGGVAVDPGTGDVWAATGPGAAADAPFGGRVVRLSPDLGPLGRTGRAPERDRGYASSPVLFQPAGCPRLVMALARSGRLDVYRVDRLGAPPLARADLAIEVTGTPTWDPVSRRIVVHTFTGARAFRFGRGCKLKTAWRRVDGGSSAGIVAAGGVGVAAVRDLRLLRLRDGRRLARLAFDPSDGGVALAAPAVAGGWIVTATTGGYAYGFRVPAR